MWHALPHSFAPWSQRRIVIDGAKMWTLSEIDWRGQMMATEDSAYGTVLTIRNVGYLGTAHFLDAPRNSSGVEKEIVSDLRFFLDGNAVVDFSPGKILSGRSFRMERTSKIRGIAVKSFVAINDNTIVETAHLHADESIDLVKAHPLMYAWTPCGTVGLFGDDSGILKRAVFVKDGRGEEVVPKAGWLAVFDPVSGTGSVCCFVRYPDGDEMALLLVDEPGVYRKVALYSLVDEVVPVGWEGTFQSVIGFFAASESDWEQKALQRVAELKNLGAIGDPRLADPKRYCREPVFRRSYDSRYLLPVTVFGHSLQPIFQLGDPLRMLSTAREKTCAEVAHRVLIGRLVAQVATPADGGGIVGR